jgi:hypothetical protein
VLVADLGSVPSLCLQLLVGLGGWPPLGSQAGGRSNRSCEALLTAAGFSQTSQPYLLDDVSGLAKRTLGFVTMVR